MVASDPENAPRVAESALFGNPVGNFETEASDHAQMRELLQPHFSPRHLHALAPRVEELTTALLDELAEQGPPADLHSKLAVPLPVLVICELLGVPTSDRDQFRSWCEDAGSVEDRTRSENGLAALFGYSLQLVQHKRAHPEDDVISRLCGEDVDDTGATLLTLALIFAGHETTVVQIDQGVLRLLANRDQWRTLQDEPALVPKAVEELMRASNFNTLGGVPRYARTDFDFDGVTIQTGDLVLLDLGSANRDPAVFVDPERLDIAREQTGHLALEHLCALFRRCPLSASRVEGGFHSTHPTVPIYAFDLRPAAVPLRHDSITGGLIELPVSWS